MEISKDAFMEMEEIIDGPMMRILRQYRAGKKITFGTKEEVEREKAIDAKWDPIKRVISDYLYYRWDGSVFVQHFATKEEEESGDPIYAPEVYYRRTDAELMKALKEANELSMRLIGKELFDLDTDDPLKTGILEYDDCRTEYLIQNRDAMNYDDFDIEILRIKGSRLDYRMQYEKERMN